MTRRVTPDDDPAALARHVAAQPRPLLVGLDVDGVLAPIVDHADDAVLLRGISEAISRLATVEQVHVAVVSGRSLRDLDRFGFGPEVELVGSHGMETRDRPMDELTAAEQSRLAALVRAAESAARSAGEGAWVEHKPASVVLHVRQAQSDPGSEALARLGAGAATIAGSTLKPGSGVLELFARPADKGTALIELSRQFRAATTVFVGDDVTDEEAFARLGDGDVSIRVGGGETLATYRLADPAAVLGWLRALST